MNPLLDTTTGLRNVCSAVCDRYHADPYAVTILMLELCCTSLRHKAPQEFDEYLKVFAEELSKEGQADNDRVQQLRDQLTDILTMINS